MEARERTTRGGSRPRRARRLGVARRAALLLEVMLALAVFTMTGLAILAVTGRAAAGLEAVRQTQRAADLAASAMARIEAGIATPETLHGPVMDDDGFASDEAGSAAFDEDPAEPTLWELDIQTEPSAFPGLTRVSVRAFKRASPGSESIVASYTLHQLVRLSAPTGGSFGEEDVLALGAGGRP